MKDQDTLSNLINIKVILSYDTIFKDNKTLNRLLKNNIKINHLILLSCLSYHDQEEISHKIKNWSSSHIKEVIMNKEKIEDYYFFSRHHKLLLLKNLLIHLMPQIKLNAINKDFKFLVKLILKVHDFEVENDNARHSISIASLYYYKDNYLHQFIRTNYIFLQNNKLNVYKEIFNKIYNIKLEDYLFVILNIISFYEERKIFLEGNLDKLDIKYWYFDLEKIDENYFNLFKNVLDLISFTIIEGKNFSNETIDDFHNFDLFRNKPFIKLDEYKYIPIDGTYIKDLLFNNLYYKTLDLLDEKTKLNFMGDFGYEFEKYSSSLIEFVSIKKISYEYISEFTFKYKTNNLKSPDAMLYDKENNVLLFIEVKSSRYLNSIYEYNTINDSQYKLKIKPWKQLYESVEKIYTIKEKDIIKDETKNKQIKDLINKNPTLMFLVVSMNDIPISADIYEIKDLTGKDISKAFFSMNIEAFEEFCNIISSDYDYSFSQILGGYNQYKKRMSVKTYLSKIKKHNHIKNNEFNKFIIDTYNNFVNSHNSQ
ncbi:hypothetical protein [Aliarcobacter butzleri]|uniref:hypothetical protein n=1 Tax=Aliarcobacter butzleri TaxID=28197 RepID=UPI0012612CE4|nr:hypothetical protein [Aliarcobacter butzleri]